MLRALSRLRTPLRSLSHTLLISIQASSSSSSSSPRHPINLQTLPSPHPISLLSSPFSSRHRKGLEDQDDEEKEDHDEGDLGVFVFSGELKRPPSLIVIQPRLRPDSLLNSKLSEALNLANSLEEQRDGIFTEDFAAKEQPPHLVVQNPAVRSRPHADTFFGQGTVENVKCHITVLESEKRIDAVFVNAIISGVQQRNLEVSWGKPVLDRVGLIIEIFNAHAETKEAKLQSELAALMYKKSRLVRVRGPGGKLTFGTSGEAEVVSARGRGSGGRGFIGGAGETELQLQRRRIQERRIRLLAEIEEVRRTRALQRSARKRHGGSQGRGLATVAVVGYTNAGKSTLVSTLSDTDLYSGDRLFATVDPRLRSVILPSGRKTLLSDTVGFISDLPVQLVEAFHATLEEVVEADLLVHVLDSSAANLEEQRSSVLQVLQQIGVSEEKIQNMIEVWNKIDLLEKDKVDEITDQEKSLGEAEDEENCNDEPVDEDDVDMVAEVLPQEDLAVFPETDEIMDHEKSLGEGKVEENQDDDPVDEDDLDKVAELSPEDLAAAGYQQTASEPTDVKTVRTSAMMGVGLQELLYLIDDKLNALNPFEKKNIFEKNCIGPFDRKWRPSYTEDDEKAAEQ